MDRTSGGSLLRRLAAGASLLVLAGCATARAVGPAGGPPPVEREFRGVWVASVANIDWPARPGLSPDEQRRSLITLLDSAAAIGLNAVVLQVRPAADALYRSRLEPWSEYLTGVQGRAPEPAYDPLEFAVQEAHRRGLELHAWFNPYRARHPTAKTPAAPDHVSRTHPEWVRSYGNLQWMDPGEPEVQAHTTQVILDVVRRYDIDAVHIDDYFYPYPIQDSAGRDVPFPDDSTYARYLRSGGRLARDDWRRRNVDEMVRGLYAAIHREKPWVRFGVSPFGVWRPGNPRQIGGFDQYGRIFADARRWWREGWLDYLAPQLYWQIERPDLSYPVLLRWWAEENASGRHLWPGIFTSRVLPGEGWQAEEIVRQVFVTRGHAGASGHIHFSMRVLSLSPDSLTPLLTRDVYREPALVPETPWISSRAPASPVLSLDGGVLRIEPRGDVEVFRWAVQTRRGDRWTTRILPAVERSVPVADAEEVRVTPVGRVGRAGRTATIRP